MNNLNFGKSSPKMCATFVFFEKTAQSKPSPIGRKFTQSGHTGNDLQFFAEEQYLIEIKSLAPLNEFKRNLRIFNANWKIRHFRERHLSE
jgi:hypothetical protein